MKNPEEQTPKEQKAADKAVKAGMDKQAKKIDGMIETEMEKGVTRGPKAPKE